MAKLGKEGATIQFLSAFPGVLVVLIIAIPKAIKLCTINFAQPTLIY